MSETASLIVGLGNPGDAYRNTRHNIGFEVVKALAEQRGMNFRHASHLIGELAQGEIDGKKLFLLLPATFMNSSGDAVRRCIDYYKVPVDQLLVVSDDVDLPLGTMRIKAKGSAGGHNGLKSVEAHLRTDHYMRFRIGVGSPTGGDLADYVLGRFGSEETPVAMQMVKKAVDILLLYLEKGGPAAMQTANAKEKKLESENQEK
ncbi:MAG: aminoacyl-tRNA hydrolase [Verrucomicrobia bacterium]|nr:aminoacyl-tRNA hydrolase [Verrucomicrobiota bacterium]